ncbi:Gfo/Idh/MocA family protein [Chelatococcus asaccharovorans]|uniref:Myo-inositol 2-dehydrogenase/D-chiro-inositol 1-dehydrogenase n=1 Tax=Chelatococcus asaccharovorans TaxID=28210 RepID=A0A2V3UI81_9HYPH|nr:Gfo/Idh/MocA family oxidoreductase [Chelatococcus asaccharovorans]MBS7706346.1 Gfo/Idh/MocA family oxidoreductase [Chelatococcus asaccharovorans]PXW65011.1 myo-inositol 2-dehydrogenase/D-chiro-inositol 1-dehydrogenase [Chelatococcus asaccharovorans]
MVSIGLIGAGRIASVHARHLRENHNARIVAIADPFAPGLAGLAAEHGARMAGSAEDIINDDGIDAVIVASSTDTHCPLMTAAAKKGKFVYCEKPLASSLAEAYAASIGLGEASEKVMVGFNRRFDRNHAAVQADLAAGRLGRVQTVQITSRGPNAIPSLAYLKVSGGLFFDKMIHFFDMVRWLTGEEPLDVVAFGSVIADPVFAEANDIDTGIVTLRMQSGALCQIENTRRAVYGYDDRVEILGTGGLIESSRITEGAVMRILDDKIMTEGLPKDPMIRMAPSYKASINAFVDFASGKLPRAMVPSINDGLRAQVIAAAADLSLRERRIVACDEITRTAGMAAMN